MAEIVFKINGKEHRVDGKFGPDVTLNEYIRNVAHLRGTKAMCREGGCGACVVNVQTALPPSNEIKTFAVNSCLVSVLSCHGWDITTIEGIGNERTGYHEIQKRLAHFNGSQCGYCSPGFVMNMYSLYMSKNKNLTTKEVENSFASNICRCTGYRPIAEAFKSFAVDADKALRDKVIDLEDLNLVKSCTRDCSDRKCLNKKSLSKNSNALNDKNDTSWCMIENPNNKTFTVTSPAHKWLKAYYLEDVFKAIQSDNNYKLIAGNTGQGVNQMTDYPTNIIDIFSVSELKEHVLDVNLILGAGISLSSLMEIFHSLSTADEDFKYLKELYDHLDLVAHIPVRNIGTIGGNLMLKHINNEFQSDLFLLFETVGGMVTLAEGKGKNITMTLPEFLKVDMNGKVIINVILPPLSQCCSLKTYKIMPRAQNSHAIVNAGFLFKFRNNSQLLESATLVFGGISRNFIHAATTEAILIDKDPYTNETLQLVLKSLHEEIQPEENPLEPSAEYRKMLAVSLYYKAILYFCPDHKVNPIYKSGWKVFKRETSKGSQSFETDKSVWPLNQPVSKLEALVQCAGEAEFSNDIPVMNDEVFAAFVTADVNPGSVISSFDTDQAFNISGVSGFYTAKDIPGNNSFTPSKIPMMDADEEILCSGKVMYYGQPVGIIIADREQTAQKAAKLVKVNYSLMSTKKPLLTIDSVLQSPEKNERMVKNQIIEPTEVGNDIKHVLSGELKLKGQYHNYMELQTCVAIPTEDGLDVYSSNQWLDLVSVAIAECLNLPVNRINVIVRRLGGGYGGKISRASQIACAAALVAHLERKPCRFILPLVTNMKAIGKRLPLNSKFEVGVNEEGVIQYLKTAFHQDHGYSFNENISARTITHLYSCYDPRRWKIESYSIITDTASNTFCRSPSSTEGVAMIENIMEYIAFNIGKDPMQVRLSNMETQNNPFPDMINQLKTDAEYDRRNEEITAYNKQNRWMKRALKLMPMTFEIYYFGNYNSVVSIYHADASVVICHGGIAMGQGLNTKVAQVCAFVLGIPLEKIRIKPSTSVVSPNAMVTGASIGSECVAFATKKACEILLERLAPIKAKGSVSWEELITKAYQEGVNLQASYVFSTKDELKSYNVYAACALEVEVDTLTGNHDVRRVDLLEDTGRSLSPLIDVGQIEGAFVMGLGYWTSENLIYDQSTGELLTNRTWTYKPPGIKDIPADMRIYFRRNAGNEHGLLQSKATGEPAFCLATIVLHAFREAIRNARLDAGYPDQWVDIGIPCTAENIFMALEHKIEHFILQ
ncbi:indole-3-acetaldehyde oxidase-like [Maniola jurtina]|uniref:indole-3-acetaldehyde oxidase-like n=1 Tax=Maniola jurtina TaxID=191418 RepID=UPI001E68A2A6|nr:indole-3-acetaldehyde oxidase-like [Maniola jurtina]